MTIKEKLKLYVENKDFSESFFCREINVSNRFLAKEGDIGANKIPLIRNKFPDLNLDWVIFDEGEMILSPEEINKSSKNTHLIPVYEEVTTIGGNNGLVAETDIAYTTPNRYINVGDLVKGATGAISHFGDSMTEYESGCLIFYRELANKTEIVWGRNHVVETSEMRITKKIAEFDEHHIMCYSTNIETYPDGTLIHQPIKIKKQNIRRIGRVLGSFKREES